MSYTLCRDVLNWLLFYNYFSPVSRYDYKNIDKGLLLINNNLSIIIFNNLNYYLSDTKLLFTGKLFLDSSKNEFSKAPNKGKKINNVEK